MSSSAPIRRNDPCPCGSGRRYKDCHGSLATPTALPTVEAQVNSALRLHQQGMIDAAERSYREILAHDPGNAIATHYLGMVAWHRGDPHEGERLMRESIAANSSIPDFHNNLGLLLRDALKPEAAIACYRKALDTDPAWFEAYSNLGLALEDAGRFDEALDAYATGIAREPRFAAARQNRARLLVAMARYAEGWGEYRWRLLAQGVRKTLPDSNERPLPASLSGRRIALASEQGIGDVLFFLRFVPELVRRGAIVSFTGDERLLPMLERTGLFAGGLSVGPHTRSLASDEVTHVGDLPWLLEANQPDRFPRALALSPLPERVASMRERLASLGPSPRIALTWRAGTASAGPASTRLKEVPLEALGQSVREVRGSWISIQRFPREGETAAISEAMGTTVHDLSGVNGDLEEMLALLSVVEECVGVSSANTHLRAALGGSMRVLVPFPPEWRWGVEGPASPWFPSMRLHRQAPNGSWSSALADLRSGFLD